MWRRGWFGILWLMSGHCSVVGVWLDRMGFGKRYDENLGVMNEVEKLREAG